MNIIELANKYSGLLSLIFSGLVTMATIIYAVLTWSLVSETKRMRKLQSEPKISITVHPTDFSIHMILLTIENIGLGIAHNISFKVIKDFEYEKGLMLSRIAMFEKGIKYLAPKQKIDFFLTSFLEDFDMKVNCELEIQVSYNNDLNEIINDSFILDFKHFKDLRWIGEPPLHKISKNIEKIQKDINRLRNKEN